MKYETKRSMVEEIVVDFEDGCVLTFRPNNIDNYTCEVVSKCHSKTTYRVNITMRKNITCLFFTEDEQLLNDFRSLISGYGCLS